MHFSDCHAHYLSFVPLLAYFPSQLHLHSKPLLIICSGASARWSSVHGPRRTPLNVGGEDSPRTTTDSSSSYISLYPLQQAYRMPLPIAELYAEPRSPFLLRSLAPTARSLSRASQVTPITTRTSTGRRVSKATFRTSVSFKPTDDPFAAFTPVEEAFDADWHLVQAEEARKSHSSSEGHPVSSKGMASGRQAGTLGSRRASFLRSLWAPFSSSAGRRAIYLASVGIYACSVHRASKLCHCRRSRRRSGGGDNRAVQQLPFRNKLAAPTCSDSGLETRVAEQLSLP